MNTRIHGLPERKKPNPWPMIFFIGVLVVILLEAFCTADYLKREGREESYNYMPEGTPAGVAEGDPNLDTLREVDEAMCQARIIEAVTLERLRLTGQMNPPSLQEQQELREQELLLGPPAVQSLLQEP